MAPEGGRLIINDAEAAQVREIFALYARYRGLIPVVEELNRRGWRTKHWTSCTGRWHPGSPFSKQALLSILNNVTYIGQINYKGTIYPGEQPPVVERELFEQVQDQLRRQRFDYLTELQRHSVDLVRNPPEWMPWNYRETLQRVSASLDSG